MQNQVQYGYGSEYARIYQCSHENQARERAQI